MIKHILIFLIISIFTCSLYGNERRSQIISIIDEELSEVTRLSKQSGGDQPSLFLRMAELLLEKARLIKEGENIKYLSIPTGQRAKVRKSSYFNESKKYFIRAEKTALLILKKFPRYKNIADVYYILAFNAKENLQDKKAEKFFKLSIKKSRKGSLTRQKATLALAEIFYNRKQYSKAIPLYERSLNKKLDKWWTKDAYNLAWCYFQTKKRSAAISKMQEVYSESRNKKFIDMSYSVERDLALFYVSANRISDAIKFYKDNGKNLTRNLIKVSKLLMDRGKFTLSRNTLKEALNRADSDSDRAQIHETLLALHDKFGKYDEHFVSSKEMFQLHKKRVLSEGQIEILKYQLERVGAILQKQATSKRYRTRTKFRRSRGNIAAEYFSMLAEVNNKKSLNSIFLAAETMYSTGQYSKALELYDRTHKQALAQKNEKYAKLALEGLLASLGKKGSKSSDKENKYLIYAYNLYLKNSKDKRKRFKVHQRLFSLLYSEGDIKKSEEALVNFQREFPKAYKKQEAMLARIMEYYRKRKDKASIGAWVKRINDGKISVSKRYANKLRNLLLVMQFETVEKATSKGDKKRALVGYVSIYRNTESTKTAKKNAAYNIAVLFYELGDWDKMNKWALRALEHMNSKDIRKFQSTFLSFAVDLFNREKFNDAIEMNQKVFQKLCNQNSKNKRVFFNNIGVIALANGDLNTTSKILEDGVSCGINRKDIENLRVDLISRLAEDKRWAKLEREISTLTTASEKGRVIPQLFELYKEYKRSGRDKLSDNVRDQIIEFYNYAQRRNIKLELEILDIVAHFSVLKLEALENNLISIRLSFPESAFNTLLKSKISALDRLTDESLRILSIGSGVGIVRAYKLLYENYLNTASEIRNFAPVGKSKEYIDSFQKSMVNLTAPILKKASDYKREASLQIKKNEILSKDNVLFIVDKDLKFRFEYWPFKKGIIMDRAGGR